MNNININILLTGELQRKIQEDSGCVENRRVAKDVEVDKEDPYKTTQTLQ